MLKPLFYWPDGYWFSEWLHTENPSIAWDQTYRKQRNFNRTSILTANGIFNLSVPVLAKFNQLCSDIQIDNSVNWALQHKKAIQFSYKNAAYFDYYFDDIEKLYAKKYSYLNDLNFSILQFIFKKLQLTEPVITKNQIISGHFVMRKEEIPEQYTQKPYFQLFGTSFQPHLGIIDVLMNLGPETKKWILE